MRNSSLVEWLCAENLAGLKPVTEALGTECTTGAASGESKGKKLNLSCKPTLKNKKIKKEVCEKFPKAQAPGSSSGALGSVGERSVSVEAVPKGAVELTEVRMPA